MPQGLSASKTQSVQTSNDPLLSDCMRSGTAYILLKLISTTMQGLTNQSKNFACVRFLALKSFLRILEETLLNELFKIEYTHSLPYI